MTRQSRQQRGIDPVPRRCQHPQTSGECFQGLPPRNEFGQHQFLGTVGTELGLLFLGGGVIVVAESMLEHADPWVAVQAARQGFRRRTGDYGDRDRDVEICPHVQQAFQLLRYIRRIVISPPKGRESFFFAPGVELAREFAPFDLSLSPQVAPRS